MDPRHTRLPEGLDTHEVAFDGCTATIVLEPGMRLVDDEFGTDMQPCICAQIWLRPHTAKRGRGARYGLAFIGEDVPDALRQVGMVWRYGGLAALAEQGATDGE